MPTKGNHYNQSDYEHIRDFFPIPFENIRRYLVDPRVFPGYIPQHEMIELKTGRVKSDGFILTFNQLPNPAHIHCQIPEKYHD
ncbi:hypothetical protein BD779DRAFT_1147484 [Infundibulicybe gibba]|nr:hypothetical protein BD779DRAFT_1147484 [Infundibulicybe gibba]